MALTVDEQTLFSAGQLTELLRMPDIKLEETYLGTNNPDILPENLAAFRAKQLAKMAALSVGQLKARVNIDEINGGVVVYSNENNYSAQEQAIINAFFDVVPKGILSIPAVLTQASAMQADGVANNVILNIARAF